MSHRLEKQRKGKDFWGPPDWAVIHILAICLRPKTAKEYLEFLWLLTRLLPCDYCKKNLIKKLRDHPPDKFLSSSEQAFMYTYILHDLANQHISQYHPKTPKISPPFDDVRDNYLQGLQSRGAGFWGPPMWTAIHVLAVTLRTENAEDFKRFLELLVVLLPDQRSRDTMEWILLEYLPDAYLRNNHDAFFYTYMIHDLVNKRLRKPKSPPYENVKSFYFSALGEECNDCKV